MDKIVITAGGGGDGDVTGPGSSADNAIVRFHETTGKVIQGYTSNPPTISDSGDVNIDGDLDVENIVVSGNVDGIDISDHDAATTAVHGVGTGTVTSVSTANKTIYVDKEATGAADGTSESDAFTTIQAAVDSCEDVIIHAYTIIVIDGTKKTGTADENKVNSLVDDGNAQFVSGDVGKRVFNVDDGTWGVVGSYMDAGDVGIIDTAGAALDLFPDGNEDYVMEATPYREAVELNSDPANYPAHLVLGSLTIQGEIYFNAICDTNAVAGKIVDATYDFSAVEVGDRVWVLDCNGANNRAQDYEWGTITDVTDAATGVLLTTLAKTPTTLWYYGIVKTEVSGSDDGTAGGTTRGNCFDVKGFDNIDINGFYFTYSDSQVVQFSRSSGSVKYCAIEDCDNGPRAQSHCVVNVSYNYIEVDDYGVWVEYQSSAEIRNNVIYMNTGSERGIYLHRHSQAKPQYNYIDNASSGADGEAIYADMGSAVELVRNHITSNFLNGAYALNNSVIFLYQCNNNATNPETPAATSEGAFINSL